MKTKLLQINNQESLIDHPGIITAGKIIKSGGLVAFPTETVYGLGANGLDPQAVLKIYQAKGRPSDNPLILHIADFTDLSNLVIQITPAIIRLSELFWPGPLTMIMKKQSCVPDKVTGGLDTVAIRMPSHPIARALIRTAGVPIAAPSANRSGIPSPTLAEHVIQDMFGRVEMIIDGGACEQGIESTIVDVTADEPILLRPGSISLEELEAVLGKVTLDEGVINQKLLKGVTPRSPGMKYKHYSPEAEIQIIEGDSLQVRELFHKLISNQTQQKLGLLITQELKDSLMLDLSEVIVKVIGEREKPEEIAARLFRLLREFDEEGVELVLAEGLPLQGIGLAVMNRLRKAAGYQIITVDSTSEI